jgi:hypothetical protein
MLLTTNQLLYIDKKKTEPVLDGQLTHTFQTRSIRLPDGFRHSHTADPTTDVFGFLTENVARYKETVKEKFPERLRSVGGTYSFQNGKPIDT